VGKNNTLGMDGLLMVTQMFYNTKIRAVFFNGFYQLLWHRFNVPL